MSISTATRGELDPYLTRLKLVAQELSKAVQGPRRIPLDADQSVAVTNLSADLAAIMEDLGIVAAGSPSLEPYEIVVDTRAPVPVKDTDTGVTIQSKIATDGGIPYVQITGGSTALVQDGTVFTVKDGVNTRVNFTSRIANGVPLEGALESFTTVLKDGADIIVYDALNVATPATLKVAANGGRQVDLPFPRRFITLGNTYPVKNSTGTLSVNANAVYASGLGFQLLSDAALVIDGAVFNKPGGGTMTAKIVNGNATFI